MYIIRAFVHLFLFSPTGAITLCRGDVEMWSFVAAAAAALSDSVSGEDRGDGHGSLIIRSLRFSEKKCIEMK
jgi:hypothetical protein